MEYLVRLAKRTLTLTDSDDKKESLTQQKTTYKNNQLKSIYYLFNGIKNEKETFYYKSGKLNKEQNWCNSLLEGISKTYYKSCELYILANYKNGKLDGDYIVYSNGELINGW